MFLTVEGYNTALTRDIICQSRDTLETIDHLLYLGPGLVQWKQLELLFYTVSIGLKSGEINVSYGPQFSDPPAPATTSAGATQNFNRNLYTIR